jgi:hypothetical protein
MTWSILFTTRRAPLLLVLLLAAAGPAAAQQPSQAQANAIRQNCRADYQTHCAGVPTSGQASLACLQENLSGLSPACRQAVGGAGNAASAAPAGSAPRGSTPAPMSRPQEAAMLRGSCGPDYRMLCRGVQPGGGRVVACLEANRSALSAGCQAALAGARPPR